MPLTDTRSSWPVETDKVPAPADVGEGGLDDDGDDDNVDDNEPPADEGFVVAKANPGAPGDRTASGAVMASGVEAAGAGPFPPRPDGPPRAWGGLVVLMDAPCVDPPTAPDDGPWCGPAMIPTAMAAAAMTTVAVPASRACRWCMTRCHGPVPGGLMGSGKPLGPNGPARFATVRRCASPAGERSASILST